MEPVVYILAILGCHDDLARCQPLALVPTRYATAAACDAGTEANVRRSFAAYSDYPLILAQCLRMDPAAAALIPSDPKAQPEEKVRPELQPTPWTTASARG